MVFNKKVMYKDKENVQTDKKEYVMPKEILNNDAQGVDETQILGEDLHVEPQTPTTAPKRSLETPKPTQ